MDDDRLCHGNKFTMIQTDEELESTLDRIRWIQGRLATLRRLETNPVNFRLSSSGFLAELDRMQLEVREYLSSLPQLTPTH